MTKIKSILKEVGNCTLVHIKPTYKMAAYFPDRIEFRIFVDDKVKIYSDLPVAGAWEVFRQIIKVAQEAKELCELVMKESQKEDKKK